MIEHKVNGPRLKSLKRLDCDVTSFDFLTVNTWLAQKSLREHRNRILGEVLEAFQLSIFIVIRFNNCDCQLQCIGKAELVSEKETINANF